MRALRQLIVSASPGDPAIQGGALVGTAHAVSFVTTLPQGFGAPATGEAEVTLAVGRTQALELLWRPHYRRWIAAPLPPVPYVLLTHVARLDLSFLGTSGSGWTSSWSARELPRLVRLHVVFTDGDTRHWPDLIVAPMRQVPPS
jgi:general secretion pathway protein J